MNIKIQNLNETVSTFSQGENIYCSDFANDRKCHVDRPYFRYQFEFSNKVFEHELQELQGWFLFAMKFVQRTLFS